MQRFASRRLPAAATRYVTTALVAALFGTLAAIPAAPAVASQAPSGATPIAPNGTGVSALTTPAYELNRWLTAAEVEKLLSGLKIGGLSGEITPEALAKALASLPALEGLKISGLEESLKTTLEGLGSGATLSLLENPTSLASTVTGLVDKLLSLEELLKLESLLGGESLQEKLEGALTKVELTELLAKLTGSSSEPAALLEQLLSGLPTEVVEKLLGTTLSEAPVSTTTVGELASGLGTTVEGLTNQLGVTVGQLQPTGEVLLAPLSNGEVLSVLPATSKVLLGTLDTLLGTKGGEGSKGGSGEGSGEGGSGGAGEGGSGAGGSGGSGSGAKGGAGGVGGAGGTSGGGSGATGTTLVVSVPAATSPAAATSPSTDAATHPAKRHGKLTVGRIRVVKHAVHGFAASIVVKTPGAGMVLVNNHRVDAVRRHVGKARRLSFRVVLSRSSARLARRRHHALRMKVRIVFKATHGRRSHAIVKLRFR